jgi:hypothetical protein
VQGLLLAQAKSGDAPDWASGYVRPSPVLSSEAKRRRDGRIEAISEAEAHAAMLLKRALYAAWHGALCEMAGLLAGYCEAHELLPPAAPAAPWHGPRDRRGARAKLVELKAAVSA